MPKQDVSQDFVKDAFTRTGKLMSVELSKQIVVKEVFYSPAASCIRGGGWE